MSEPRDKQVVVNVEETIYDVVALIANKEDMSMSSYVRQLIVRDAINRGMLTERTLGKILLG